MTLDEIDIPPEALAAGQIAAASNGIIITPLALGATFSAMMKAWPGIERDKLFHGFADGTHYFQPRIILPLTTEARDKRSPTAGEPSDA